MHLGDAGFNAVIGGRGTLHGSEETQTVMRVLERWD